MTTDTGSADTSPRKPGRDCDSFRCPAELAVAAGCAVSGRCRAADYHR